MCLRIYFSLTAAVVLIFMVTYRITSYASDSNPHPDEITTRGEAAGPSTVSEVLLSEGGPKGSLTLGDAVSLALQKNPDLLSLSWEVRAREARIVQSRMAPNPELEIEAENFLGNKDVRNFEKAETTVSLSQLIELGGKRAGRARMATLDRDLAQWDYEAKRLDVLAEVTRAFVDVVAEQERLSLTEELVRLAEQSLNAASARVHAGKVSPIDESKASAALAMTRIEMERSRRSLDAARKRLATMWGSSSPVFTKAEGRLDSEASLPSFQQLSQQIPGSPDISRWTTEVEQREAAVSLEKAARVPDPVLAGGIRWFSETEGRAFVAAIRIPLPVFNRNRGGVLEAENRRAKAQEEQRAARLRVENALTDAYRTMSSAFMEASFLRNDVLPALQTAFDATREGYKFGKFGYLDVLDAQRTLFESRVKYIEALAALRKASAEVSRLIGTYADNSAGPSQAR